ncbi:hypothetical protein HanRHA438_Chr04g0178391 [Helianthus annuus]|nr:hypothetical protein HanRHA438_Chr04g0178391 [Helianthus annuus]
MGGLGLHSLKDNNALLSKWGWRFKTKRDNLWVGVINALHSSGSDWDFVPQTKSLSGVWCNIVASIKRPFLVGSSICNLFKGAVGRGDNIMFWLDPWLGDVPLKLKFPSSFKLELFKSCSVRDRLEGDGLWRWRHELDSSSERLEWDSLIAYLGSVTLSDNPDRWLWVGNGSADFSVEETLT